MPDYPSAAPNAELSQLFVSRIPDPEQLVYSYVKAATAGAPLQGAPQLAFYSDPARAAAEGRTIDVVRGWPAYPGKVPAIGIGSGEEGEDPAQEVIQGGFAGEVYAYDGAGNVLGAADYYAEALYIPIVVLLIHENRDERDRLHNLLRLVLSPLRTWLPTADAQIKKVRVDMSKDEQHSDGPPVSEQPFSVYQSITTVHVFCEALTPRNIVDTNGIAQSFQVTSLVDRQPVRAIYRLPVDSR